jgi:hypothetical protein
LGSLVDSPPCFIVTIILGEGYGEVQPNLLTESCQNVGLQNRWKKSYEGEIFDMTEMQNQYKTVIESKVDCTIEKLDELPVYL